jgi:hypothetical protein
VTVCGFVVRLRGAALFGLAPSIFARRQGGVRREPMAKQSSTQSQGSGVAGTETTTEQGLDAVLEPLLLVLEEPVGEVVGAAVDVLGQILSSGSIDAAQVRVLAEAEDLLDQVDRALEGARAAILGGDA